MVMDVFVMMDIYIMCKYIEMREWCCEMHTLFTRRPERSIASLASPPRPWVWLEVLKESFFTMVLSLAKGEEG